MKESIFIYLALSAEGPDGGRIFTSASAPAELVERYEDENPGWYLKRVWPVAGPKEAEAQAKAIKLAYPNRTFTLDLAA